MVGLTVEVEVTSVKMSRSSEPERSKKSIGVEKEKEEMDNWERLLKELKIDQIDLHASEQSHSLSSSSFSSPSSRPGISKETRAKRRSLPESSSSLHASHKSQKQSSKSDTRIRISPYSTDRLPETPYHRSRRFQTRSNSILSPSLEYSRNSCKAYVSSEEQTHRYTERSRSRSRHEKSSRERQSMTNMLPLPAPAPLQKEPSSHSKKERYFHTREWFDKRREKFSSSSSPDKKHGRYSNHSNRHHDKKCNSPPKKHFPPAGVPRNFIRSTTPPGPYPYPIKKHNLPRSSQEYAAYESISTPKHTLAPIEIEIVKNRPELPKKDLYYNISNFNEEAAAKTYREAEQEARDYCLGIPSQSASRKPGGDEETTIRNILEEIKGRGILDKIRKDCLAAAQANDTFQTLINLVQEATRKFLSSDAAVTLSRNSHCLALREAMRKQILYEPFFDPSVDGMIEDILGEKVGFIPEDWRRLDSETQQARVADLVNKLSDHIMDSVWTKTIGDNFPALLPVVLNKFISETEKNKKTVPIVQFITAISKLIGRHSSVLRFAESYFSKTFSPLKIYLKQLESSLHEGPLRKRAKRSSNGSNESPVEFLKSLLVIMKILSQHVYSTWELNSFLQIMDSHLRNEEIRWLTLNCMALMLNIGDEDLAKVTRKMNVSAQTAQRLALEFQIYFERLCVPENNLGSEDCSNILLPGNEIKTLSSQIGLMSIGGVLVSTAVNLIEEKQKSSTMITLDSTMSYVREIALSISGKTMKPICLMGPVGVGKSSLLTYTAALFGKNKYPQIISVQMSDQIDARLLLGSYHSTDLPGQFVWKPGCLTKAVLNGYWIILEDLDSAPPDVLTLLGGLIDTRKLSVPGYGEVSKIHQDFRILATSRTHVGKRVDKLGKQWKKLIIEALNDSEMKILISAQFPHLRPILDRLLCILQAVRELNSGTSGRIVSLRDFLKFCRRIPSPLDFTQTSSAILIFQEAFDLFAASFPSSTTKQEIAESLGTHMGLLKAKTEYFCTQYKPHVSICNNTNTLTSGRYTLPMYQQNLPNAFREDTGVFSLTRRASCLMEMICGSLKNHEPVLLIGETGVGKTSCVQYMANILAQPLVVINLNRQSDSGDLLGGYKPVELKFILGPIREEFETLFVKTFSRDANKKFMHHIMTCFVNRRWYDLVKLMVHVQKEALARGATKKDLPPTLVQRWTALGHKLARIQLQVKSGEESPFAFSFIEGTLISAIKKGHWILLDEINLATPEMLQCLSGILDEDSDIHLWEKGDDGPIKRNPNFHLFAAMNPSTDVGKKDLPLGLRNRFTEFYVEELTDPIELQVLVSDYLRDLCLPASKIEKIVGFYLDIRTMSNSALTDGIGKKPHFSLRTLCRALKISAMNLYGSVNRSLYESFCLSFLTQLDFSSHPVVQNLIAKSILGDVNIKSVINQPLPIPTNGKFIQVEGYWIPRGDVEPKEPENYILTASIRRNMKDLARIVSAGKLPILIQGETSVGKTSLIQYLANITGNNCYRINNHQHTDLQEYAGSYQSDANGKLVFTEGVLVQAMRRGEWIILDELNLAPSEVMEALNRLLDDNRQLFIPETGQTVPAHPRFMLFATQNPPGLYGGRKLLSRAFRNRFVELHFDEIPSVELENILHLRCAIPQSYCKKIIGVLRELQMRRKSSAALEGKHGFATLRDLFRWAERYRLSGEQKSKFYDWDQHLADEGYLVLAGKVRKPAEANLIAEVIQKHLKRTVNSNNLFSLHEKTSTVTKPILEFILKSNAHEFKHVVWTFPMRKLAVLVGNALKFKEPVLLVGETGCGKTTIVQLLCKLFNQTLYSVNCHMHSEGSDFLGGLRPVRNHQAEDERLFEWVNGPLVEAMENGGIFLADEISLADDSVLERVNSVLEPERTLLIAEKGDETPRLVVAHPKFHFIGTMNPGGDYGKKELSPALRNRLTEIWSETTTEPSDLEAIIEHNLAEQLKGKGIPGIMLAFVNWLKNNELGHRVVISIRDYLAWAEFINHSQGGSGGRASAADIISLSASIHHGACLAFLDGLGSGTTSTENTTLSQNIKLAAINFLKTLTASLTLPSESTLPSYTVTHSDETISIGPFSIPRNKNLPPVPASELAFHLEAPTTSQNGLRVLRAMQLHKPILLEGSPGVGKTALVSALAKLCGYTLVRINLSEQTDISDLFGADLPVEGETGGHFAWRDGPLLQALKNGSWILLDELNLASQSVLEGLNACLDHRGEIYVPELNRTFKIGQAGGTTNRIVGCQNPLRQGGARKGLPKSFLNRFTQVFMDPLDTEDLTWILQSSFPSLPKDFVQIMCHFADSVTKAVCQLGLFGAKGSPWDFNLRDLIRWSELMIKVGGSDSCAPNLFVDLIYGMRMRSEDDRRKIEQLFQESVAKFKSDNNKIVLKCGASGYHLLDNKFMCGNGVLVRGSESGSESDDTNLQVLQKQLPALEGLTVCLQMGWMPILVGPSGSGKTSLIKLLSHLSGHRISIMTVSPEMDTIDLLGGFEQADIYRKIDETSSGLREMIRCLVKGIVCQMGNKLDLMDFQLLDLWSSIQSLPQLAPEGEVVGHEEELKRLGTRVDFLRTSHSKCKSLLGEMKSRKKKRLESQMMEIREEFQIVEEGLERVSKELKHIETHLKSGIQTGAFQWVDSLLIKAIVSGDWLLIDGANRCSAAVLDRLNSLMEPNGSLFLSERGSIDGEIVQIRPHPNFRLILTVDPAYGEISRAMRNRGVEIFMPGPEEETTYDDNLFGNHHGDEGFSATVSRILGVKSPEDEMMEEPLSSAAESTKPRINLFDLDSILRAEGITDPHLRDTLINLHEQIHQTVAPHLGGGERPTVHHLVEAVRSFLLEMKVGTRTRILDAIHNSFISTYVLGSPQLIDSQLRRSQIESILRNVNFELGNDCVTSPRFSLSLKNFITPQLFRVWKELEVMMNIFCTKPLGPIANILMNSRDKELLEELVLTGLFLRTRSQDAQLLASTLSLKTKKLERRRIMNLCEALAQTLSSSSSSEDDFPWDLQWSPHSLAAASSTERKLSSMVLKLSLGIHYHLFMTRFGPGYSCSQEGTLGFISKAVSKGTFTGESLKNTQFLTNFSSLVENLERVLLIFDLRSESGSGARISSHLCSSSPELWVQGLCSFLWRQRLLDLCGEAWSIKSGSSNSSSNERLNSNVTLVIIWIGEHVVKFLKEIGEEAAANEVKQIGLKCLDNVDHFSGESRDLIRKGQLLREIFSHKPFHVRKFTSDAELISATIETCFEIWSLTSFIPGKIFISALNSTQGHKLHTIVTRIVRKILSGDELLEEDRFDLLSTKDGLTQLNAPHLVNTFEDPSGINKMKESLIGLREYIRICDNESASSSFVNPLLLTLAWSEEQQPMKHYFAWEDRQKFRQLYSAGSGSGYGFNLSTQFPHFISNIISEEDHEDGFRIASLGSRVETKEILEQVRSILTQKITRPVRTELEFVKTLGSAFGEVLESVKNILGQELCEKWKAELKVDDDDLGNEKIIQKIASVGGIMVKGGATLMQVGTFMPIVDPAVEKEILSGYLNTEVIFFETWLDAQRIHQLTQTGSDLMNSHVATLHPYISKCAHHLKKCRSEMIEAQSGIAHRPDPPNYVAIKQEILQFVKGFASVGKMEEIVGKVFNLLSNSLAVTSSQQEIDAVLMPCQIWIESHINFIKKLAKEFWYWDVISPFLFASVQVSTGMSLLVDAMLRLKTIAVADEMEKAFQYIQFPISYKPDAINPETNEILQQQFSNKTFASTLITFMNEAETEGRLSHSVVKKLHALTSQVHSLWVAQEEENERKKELEDSMYVYKGHERSMEPSEEEQEAKEMARTFPTFEDEFQAIQDSVSNTLEGSVKEKKDTKKTYNEALTRENITIFLKIQARLLNRVKTHWIEGKCTELGLAQDFVTPFLNQFEVGSEALANFNYNAKEDEEKYIPGALVAVHHLNSNYEPVDFFRATELYDFYHDPNIEEAQKLNSILSGLRKRVQELLAEWPDHPALQKIVEILDRIESFKIDDSLMKFLTGLELLLGFAQDWESCAHQGVSIAIHLSEITELIINWRKLELQCWKNLLTITFQKEQTECHKWWFHLYAAVKEVTVSMDTADLLDTLRKFIETSPIGQFETRLALLYRIHCYVISMEQFEDLRGRNRFTQLHAYIWNTYIYYQQFSEAVAVKLAALRSITEKKLKDFVKISRWNDANYYALKDSVQKSQRTLGKLVKEWRKALQTPVATILTADLSSTMGAQEIKKLRNGGGRPLKISGFLTPSIWREKCQIDQELVESLNIKRFGKLRKFFDKIQGIVQFAVGKDSTFYADEIGKVEELTGAIIETSHELQSLEVSEQNAEKRKKMLHNIHSRRRAALANLFKVLQESKLSYRSGLIKIKAAGGKFVSDFTLSPVNLEAGWKHLPNDGKSTGDKELLSSWKGCEDYFQKCISRIAVMMKAFDHPSKELGPTINDRCKGFIVDLMNLTCEQKKLIAQVSESLWSLKILTAKDSSSTITSTAEVNAIYTEACRIEYETRQFLILVESLASTSNDNDNRRQKLQWILEKTTKIKNLLQGSVNSIYTGIFASTPGMSVCEKNVDTCLQVLGEIRHLIQNFVNAEDSILCLKVSQMDKHIVDFLIARGGIAMPDSETTRSPQLVGKIASKLLREILLAFQNLDQCKNNGEREKAAAVAEEEDEEPRPSLTKFPIPEIKYFDLSLIVRKTKKILKLLEDNKNEHSVFQGILPLLTQLATAVQFYLTLLVQFHRATCKLTSVLAGIFATLGSKGFCLPADYEDQAVAEGSELDAKSGMGLGEGETTSDAQDVSDRLESEDQLEDTLKQGETVESADNDLDEEDKGVEMSEDFDGKQQDKQEKKPGDNDDSDNESEDEKDEDELDKQMGDIDDPEAEKLDEQMWGGSSDEEDEDLNDKEKDKGKGSAQDQVQEMGAKDPSLEEADSDNEEEEPQPDSKEKEQKRKDINEQDDSDQELNDDQTDPYHGKAQPEEEPEPLDLPDDLNLDNADPKDNEGEDEGENPFDLDKGEKNMEETPEPVEEMEEEKEPDPNEVTGEDDEENPMEKGKDLNVDIPDLDEPKEDDKGNPEEVLEDLPAETEIEDMDQDDAVQDNPSQEQRKEDKSEPSEETSGQTQDQTQTVENENAKGPQKEKQEQVQSTKEENSSKKDESASGQAESQDGTGHEGAKVKDENQIKPQLDESRKDVTRKPGETDNKRSLADNSLEQPKANRLKTIKSPEDDDKTEENSAQPDDEEDSSKNMADLFQHIKDSQAKDALTVDNATQDQADQQKPPSKSDNPDETNENPELDEEMPLEPPAGTDDEPEINPEILDNAQKPNEGKDKDKRLKKSELSQVENMEVDDEVIVEGETVLTLGAQRPNTSVIETRLDLLEEWSREKATAAAVEESTHINYTPTYMTSAEESAALVQWHDLDSKTLHLAQELCEQLRLILEPTQAARLRGDYKTGKRLNMRKVIPYIASGFRKDKIWLRRTQPSKREYQILLALDDSASMSDNQSKQMAFSAVAVVARSLGLLEAGQLAVVSFGEDTQLLHPFEEPFSDFSGARLLQRFTFCQRRTRIAQLLKTTSTLFAQAKENQPPSSVAPELAQLLLIISDGRGVTHEGSMTVKNAIRLVREQNIFVVFIIVDNPENKDSILDIRLPIFNEANNSIVEIAKYMDYFPFPFYLILRDLSALPSVLSDALRQWFELVTSSER